MTLSMTLSVSISYENYQGEGNKKKDETNGYIISGIKTSILRNFTKPNYNVPNEAQLRK